MLTELFLLVSGLVLTCVTVYIVLCYLFYVLTHKGDEGFIEWLNNRQ